ncbi:hypothetical protein NC652_017495 [Populus alba x Populus x berolinensis]|nr:hypothetical protein NC652_017495 [Populus alba x Populus x berolinensis]
MTIYIILIPGNVSLHAAAFTFSMRSAASSTVAMFSAPPSPIDTLNCSSKASGHAGAAGKLAICAVQQLQPQERKNNLKQESEGLGVGRSLPCCPSAYELGSKAVLAYT